MSIGFFVIPSPVLVFLASLFIALLAGWLLRKRAGSIERDVMWIVIGALVVARLSFVGHYLPYFRASPLSIFDIRDLGFGPRAGIVAGAAIFAWRVLRNRPARLSLTIAAAAAVVTYGTAHSLIDGRQADSTLPSIELQTVEGAPHRLATQGKPTIVNLWATWCPPCQAELPAFSAMQAANPRVQFVFVSQGEQPVAVQQFIAKRALRLHNVLLDPQILVGHRVGVSAFPTTLFYDANGKLIATHLGPFSAATLHAAIEQFYGSQL